MNVHVAHIMATGFSMSSRGPIGRPPAPAQPDTFGWRLRELRLKANKQQDEVAEATNISRPQYGKYESGEMTDPKEVFVRAAARYFRVTPEYLRYGHSTSRIERVTGRVGAGGRVEAVEIELGREIEIPATWDDATLLEIAGDSCWPIYESRDIIVIRGQRRLVEEECLRKMCVVETADGLGFVKRIRRGSHPGLYTLDSPNLAPIEDVRVVSARPVALHVPE